MLSPLTVSVIAIAAVRRILYNHQSRSLKRLQKEAAEQGMPLEVNPIIKYL